MHADNSLHKTRSRMNNDLPTARINCNRAGATRFTRRAEIKITKARNSDATAGGAGVIAGFGWVDNRVAAKRSRRVTGGGIAVSIIWIVQRIAVSRDGNTNRAAAGDTQFVGEANRGFQFLIKSGTIKISLLNKSGKGKNRQRGKNNQHHN